MIQRYEIDGWDATMLEDSTGAFVKHADHKSLANKAYGLLAFFRSYIESGEKLNADDVKNYEEIMKELKS